MKWTYYKIITLATRYRSSDKSDPNKWVLKEKLEELITEQVVLLEW
jgi:hypothetical protein